MMKASNSSLEQKRPLLFVIGLLFAFSFTLVSFEWRTPYREIVIPQLGSDPWEEPITIPITLPEPDEKRQRPDPPKQKEPQTIEVKTEPTVVGKQEPDVLSQTDFIAGPDIDPDPEPEVDDGNIKPVRWSSQMPEYCNGKLAMRRFIGENLNYPQIPKENGVSGTVGVQFVVGKDGTVRDVKVVRSVDPWLDAEALRVAKLLDCFTPGKQAGRPIPVYFLLPVKFQLL